MRENRQYLYAFYVGHSKLMKITSLDREEMKKREKEMKKRKDEEEESRGPLVWIKYTLGLKHQVGCCLEKKHRNLNSSEAC